MSNTVQVRFTSFLPGSGFNSAGNPKQGKTRVVGKITVTNYSHGGEDLTPSDVGLTVIDYIDIKVDEAVGGNDGGQSRLVHYATSSQQFYVLEDSVQVGSGTDPVLSFVAEGDSAGDVEIF